MNAHPRAIRAVVSASQECRQEECDGRILAGYTRPMPALRGLHGCGEGLRGKEIREWRGCGSALLIRRSSVRARRGQPHVFPCVRRTFAVPLRMAKGRRRRLGRFWPGTGELAERLPGSERRAGSRVSRGVRPQHHVGLAWPRTFSMILGNGSQLQAQGRRGAAEHVGKGRDPNSEVA